eukprot:SAG22_NODE_16_length_32723_cov_26.404825_31_plen_59_part_00
MSASQLSNGGGSRRPSSASTVMGLSSREGEQWIGGTPSRMLGKDRQTARKGTVLDRHL